MKKAILILLFIILCFAGLPFADEKTDIGTIFFDGAKVRIWTYPDNIIEQEIKAKSYHTFHLNNTTVSVYPNSIYVKHGNKISVMIVYKNGGYRLSILDLDDENLYIFEPPKYYWYIDERR